MANDLEEWWSFQRGIMGLNLLYVLFQTVSMSFTQADSHTVNSFYGPGSFVAWFLTSILTLLSGECRILLDRFPRKVLIASSPKPHTKYQLLEDDATHIKDNLDFDAAMLATFAYPTVSSVEVLIRASNHEYSPRREAAHCVTRIGAMISFFAILFDLHKEQHPSVESLPTSSARRRASWVMLWSLCTFASVLQPTTGWFTAISLALSLLSAVNVFTITQVYMGLPGKDLDFTWYLSASVWAGVFLALMLFLGIPMAADTTVRPFKVRISFPRSGSGLGDQDQWFALLNALILVIGPACRKIYRIRQSRSLIKKS
ncbi:uncharacterized protein EI97DRAFT_429285 [Westerdykella ornata]|uniref:Uncharacterized protein n=1 Tax=Westerdykella ornata TaxID=318751 RepID=A0A6A6JX87_WESOR|nr:uncharacterized protein EI97DRAFT_429285 [Westerdykella ornata]KAF2281232.1 hypothetical protein EI97DRAFT_429285 [Westerdykella ornata]